MCQRFGKKVWLLLQITYIHWQEMRTVSHGLKPGVPTWHASHSTVCMSLCVAETFFICSCFSHHHHDQQLWLFPLQKAVSFLDSPLRLCIYSIWIIHLLESHFFILCQNHLALYHLSSGAEPEFLIASKLSLAPLRFPIKLWFIWKTIYIRY